jgi:hypothetical protein
MISKGFGLTHTEQINSQTPNKTVLGREAKKIIHPSAAILAETQGERTVAIKGVGGGQ